MVTVADAAEKRPVDEVWSCLPPAHLPRCRCFPGEQLHQRHHRGACSCHHPLHGPNQPDVWWCDGGDTYGGTLVSHSLGDGVTEQGSVTEADQSLTWELSADVDMAYEGDYTLQYQTIDDLNFTDSSYSVYVELSEPLSPEEAAKAQQGGDALPAMASAGTVGEPGDQDAAGQGEALPRRSSFPPSPRSGHPGSNPAPTPLPPHGPGG